MGYCQPRWISPFNYNIMLNYLRVGVPLAPLIITRESSESRQPEPSHAQASPSLTAFLAPVPVWDVSGQIVANAAVLDPLIIESGVDIGTQAGTYSIDVLDSGGAILYQRLFTPDIPVVETDIDSSTAAAGSISEPLEFLEQIPVVRGAAKVVVLDPTSSIIGQIVLGGIPPVVSPVTVSGLPLVLGTQTVSWSVTSGKQAATIVQYSADSGGTWSDVAFLGNDTSVPLDFTNLPGSQSTGSSLLRVFVSDGVNTAEGDSQPFTVPKKLPSDPIIDLPIANDIFRRNEFAILSGSAYDGDDGILGGNAISWTSSIDGPLGTGSELILGTLSAGQHRVTMMAKDNDGNTTSTTTYFTVSSGPPEVSLMFNQPANTTACPSVTIGVLADPNVPLLSASYSLDNGLTMTAVPIGSLPFTFPVFGSGTISLLVMVENIVGEEGFATASYTIASPCQFPLATRVAPARSGRIIASPSSANGYYNGGTSVQLTAIANPGYTFTGFSGDLTGTNNPQSITMNGPKSVTANFLQLPRPGLEYFGMVSGT
jgi:hypothetical protein